MYLKLFNLRLFDGEGGTAGAPGGTGSEAGGNVSSPDAAGKDESAVRYGKQIEETTEETTTQEEEQQKAPAKATFEELIKGEYKKDFDSRVQQILDGRFKDYKSTKENAKKAEPLMSFLANQFGKDASDYDGILSALMDEDALFEAAALKDGSSVQEYKTKIRGKMENDRFRRENEELKAEISRQQQREEDARFQQFIREEADKVKAIYPNFDFDNEFRTNSDFADLLKRGVNMKAAYEVIHKDELLSGAMAYTAQKTAEQVANNIKARSSRPAENGTKGQAASTVKSDPNTWTKSDMDRIRAMVERGEKIYL